MTDTPERLWLLPEGADSRITALDPGDGGVEYIRADQANPWISIDEEKAPGGQHLEVWSAKYGYINIAIKCKVTGDNPWGWLGKGDRILHWHPTHWRYIRGPREENDD